jgi:hypothetical protein
MSSSSRALATSISNLINLRCAINICKFEIFGLCNRLSKRLLNYDYALPLNKLEKEKLAMEMHSRGLLSYCFKKTNA